MFTGLVEETGKVISVRGDGQSAQISIGCKKVLEGTVVGDSIAVNGICLTVVSKDEHSFQAEVMPETMRVSSLSAAKNGYRVNLERAMSAQGRFGGHIVSGHIDGTGTVEQIVIEGMARLITIQPENRVLMKYVIEKGSIAVDGISLTVARCSVDHFTVSIIPHTSKATTLLDNKKGDRVNLEFDVIGKYTEKLILCSKSSLKDKPKHENSMTIDFLKKNGF